MAETPHLKCLFGIKQLNARTIDHDNSDIVHFRGDIATSADTLLSLGIVGDRRGNSYNSTEAAWVPMETLERKKGKSSPK